MSARTRRWGWRRCRTATAGLVLIGVVAAVMPMGVAYAAPAPYPGALRLTVTSVVAGTSGATLGWRYLAPAQSVTATIGIDVPSAFPVPQATSPTSPGYVSAASVGCAEFEVTGVASQSDGSSLVNIGVQCAAGRVGTVTYSDVAVPIAAGRYVFEATFTPSGSTAVPFTQGHTVTVSPASLASLIITPAAAEIGPGAMQAYTTKGYDAYGNPLGNLTAATQFSIAPDGTCTANVCTATNLGRHIVTATDSGVTEAATLTVAEADLSIAETVSNASPDYYTPVTFTTTVTNTSSRFPSHGVTVAVNEPAALISPSASSAHYNPVSGLWTVGSLAPGAIATLTITGDAGDVGAGTQTVTATASATTYDPNPANNTASASEASQPALAAANITPDPNNTNPVDVCNPGTDTWYGSATNTANPAAPPFPASGYTITWTCQNATGPDPCPQPLNNIQNSAYISFNAESLELNQNYDLILRIVSNGTDPNLGPAGTDATPTMYQFTTTCIA